MSSPPEPLLSLRAAVILLIALFVGVIAGVLSYLASSNIAAAALVGGGAVTVILPVTHSILVQG